MIIMSKLMQQRLNTPYTFHTDPGILGLALLTVADGFVQCLGPNLSVNQYIQLGIILCVFLFMTTEVFIYSTLAAYFLSLGSKSWVDIQTSTFKDESKF